MEPDNQLLKDTASVVISIKNAYCITLYWNGDSCNFS